MRSIAAFVLGLLISAASLSAAAQAAPSGATSQPSAAAAATAAGAPAAPTDWLTQIRKPLPWLAFEGDFRARQEYTLNLPGLNQDTPGHEKSYQRYRTRLGVTVTPVENVDFNARLAWEFFNFCEPKIGNIRDTDPNEVVLDKFNVVWKKTFGLDNTLTVGRQDITDLGNGWLIFDGTPIDGSRTIFFDAVRDTFEIKDCKTVIDAIFVDNGASEEKHVEPFNPTAERYFVENDETGAILYVRNKSIERTLIDGFYIFRNTEKVTPAGWNSDLHTFGGSVEHAFNEHWIARGALAEQVGDHESQNVWAQAFNGRLTYKFRDKLDTDAYTGYEFLSGNKHGEENWNQFDPLWGRWPQFSEIVNSLDSTENVVGFTTNMHRIYWGMITRPKPFEFSVNYHLLFADQNYDDRPGYSNDGCFRGQLITAVARWEVCQHMAMQLVGETFFPGDFYTDARNDPAVFARYEIVFKW